MNIFSILNFVLTFIPLLVYSGAGLFFYSWGTQFVIECIEAIVFIFLMSFLTVLEFKTGKILDYEPVLDEDEFAGMTPEEIQKRLLFRKRMAMLKEGEFEDGLIKSQRSFMSLPDRLFPDDVSEVSHAHTFPLSPEEEEEMMKGEFFNSRFRSSDNCYADS